MGAVSLAKGYNTETEPVGIVDRETGGVIDERGRWYWKKKKRSEAFT